MTLYEINEQLQRLLELPDGEAVDSETGEVFSAEAVRQLAISFDEKIEGCGVYCKSCDAEIAARKAEIEVQKKAIARLEKNRDRTVELVRRFAGLNAINRQFKTPKVTWKWKLNPDHVEIKEGLTPADFPGYTRVKTEIDKSAIKAALKEGKEVKGAWLAQDETIAYG